jgi:P-type E1-E2 ATPase
MILQFIPSISTNSPLATMIPLAFVILLAILKDFIAEIIRWREDRASNSTLCRRLLPASSYAAGDVQFKFEAVRLDQVKVGDILELKDDDVIPADCVLLRTDNHSGQAFVQTAQLDGERTLKPKMAPVGVSKNFT